MTRPARGAGLTAFLSFAVVRAAKIEALEPSWDGSALLHLEGQPEPVRSSTQWHILYSPRDTGDRGYYIVHEDGSDGWAPTKTFERNHMALRGGVPETSREMTPSAS